MEWLLFLKGDSSYIIKILLPDYILREIPGNLYCACVCMCLWVVVDLWGKVVCSANNYA